MLDYLTQGDHIAFLAVPGCGLETCDECSRDLAQLCPAGHHSGIGQDGFYAPYATIDVRGAAKLPKGDFQTYEPLRYNS
jgi:alcohol dehydrogenase, propanol-preferring